MRMGRLGWVAMALMFSAGEPASAQETIALAIEGWRWSPCGTTESKSSFPREAFALLHRQFPDSEWAKKTKYWYD